MEQETNSLKQTARLAGLFYLLQVLTIGFNLGYVRSTLIVAGDAAATAANITTNESLFRLAMASNIISQLFLFFFGIGRRFRRNHIRRKRLGGDSKSENHRSGKENRESHLRFGIKISERRFI